MAKINGSKVKILVAGIAISNLKKVDIDVNGAMIDVTTKDSNGWKEVIPGLKDAKMTFEGSVDESAAYPAGNIFTSIVNGTSAAIIFYGSDQTNAGKSYSATGYFTSFKKTAGTEDEYTFSGSIIITGSMSQVAST